MRARLMMGALALAACEAVPTRAPAPPEDAATIPADLGCDALVPIEADDTAEGVARERAWLSANYPGFEVLREQPDDCDGVPVDRVVFVHGGVQHTVLFDTSSFYGRVDGDDLDDLLDG